MRYLFVLFIMFSLGVNAQRNFTGDKVFSSKFGTEYIVNSNSDITVTNSMPNDIVLVLKTRFNRYVTHAYIRTGQSYTFTNLPIGDMYYLFSSKDSYYKDDSLMNIERNYGYTLRLYQTQVRGGGSGAKTTNANDFFN